MENINKATVLGFNENPIAGKSILEEQAKLTVPEDAPYSIEKVTWYTFEDNLYTEFVPDEKSVYELDTTYSINVRLKADSGYEFKKGDQYGFNNNPEIKRYASLVDFDTFSLSSPNVTAKLPQNDIAPDGTYKVKLYSRNPEASLITGDGCMEVEIEISDGKIPECPEEFKFDGWEFWGWTPISTSASVIYNPGDPLTNYAVEDGIYASWYKPSEYELGDTTEKGGEVVDKYLSYYSGGVKYKNVNMGQTVCEYDHYAPDATVSMTKHEIIFPTEYPIIKYADETNSVFPVTLIASIEAKYLESKEWPTIMDDEARADFFPDNISPNQNINNLFMKDEDGYWYYDSSNTHAQYDKNTNAFVLYENLLISSNSKDQERFGFFSPFNQYTEGAFSAGSFVPTRGQAFTTYPFDELYLLNEMRPTYYGTRNSFYFGLTGKTNFLQRRNGKMPSGEDCIYEFSGDDIMYVYIDDILIFNAGTTLYGYDSYSTINFATGNVVKGVSNNAPRSETTLYDIYKNCGKYSEAELSEIFTQNSDATYRFKDYSEHTFEFFYADTGSVVSRLMTKFSFLLEKDTTELSITKKTEGDMGNFADASFDMQVYFDDVLYTGMYTIGEEQFEAVDGIITLKDGETALIPNVEIDASYEIKEVNLPAAFNTPVYTESANGTVPKEGLEVVVTNSLGDPDVATDIITVEKVVDGEPEADEIFEFVIEGQDNAPMPESDKITIEGEGTVDFGKITFTEEGTYVYTITETNKGVENYTYDDTVYTVTYTVTLNEDHILVAEKTITADEETDKIVFTNVYTAPVVEQPPVEEPKDDTPVTGDNTNSALLFAVVVIAIGGITLTTHNKKQRQ